jgi:hypothetical protein
MPQVSVIVFSISLRSLQRDSYSKALQARVTQMKANTAPHATMTALNAFFVDGRGCGSRMVSKTKNASGKP